MIYKMVSICFNSLIIPITPRLGGCIWWFPGFRFNEKLPPLVIYKFNDELMNFLQILIINSFFIQLVPKLCRLLMISYLLLLMLLGVDTRRRLSVIHGIDITFYSSIMVHHCVIRRNVTPWRVLQTTSAKWTLRPSLTRIIITYVCWVKVTIPIEE